MGRWQVVLVAHGSTDHRWRQPLEELVEGLRADLGADAVGLAFLESAEPTVLSVAAGAAASAMAGIQILPLFMAHGGPRTQALLSQVEVARRRHPDLAIHVLAPVGEDPRMVSLLREMVREASAGPALTGPDFRH